VVVGPGGSGKSTLLRLASGGIEPDRGQVWLEGDRLDFPLGLKTRVGPGGGRLSAGGRARLALARAVAVRPRLLLIDDPAFLLDPAPIQALGQVLRGWRGAMVCVGTRDRLSEWATEVWHLESGEVAIERLLPRDGRGEELGGGTREGPPIRPQYTPSTMFFSMAPNGRTSPTPSQA
jgi:ATPase subunit of ABC transporter with duplicated ATPase domains